MKGFSRSLLTSAATRILVVLAVVHGSFGGITKMTGGNVTTSTKIEGAARAKACGVSIATGSGFDSGPPGYSDAATGIRNASGGTVASGSITVAGANTMLVVCVGEYGSTISGVATSNGQALTKLSGTNSFDASGKAEIWYIAAPTAGAQTVTATFAASVTEASISVILITNVATITAGSTTFLGTRSTTIGPDTVSTTTSDLVGSGTVFFRPSLTITASGSGQTKRAVSLQATDITSSLMSTMPGVSGTASIGYTTDGLGTEYSDMAFKLSHP